MVYAGLIFAGLAALLHVYIWVMESLTWTSARTRATFGTTEEEAQATKELAFNQGFYNLFLAIVTVVGIVIGGFGTRDVGVRARSSRAPGRCSPRRWCCSRRRPTRRARPSRRELSR